MTWQAYAAKADDGNTVVGNILLKPDVHSPELGNQRDLLVYLPPSYEEGGSRRYPVLYMHDGQNLFDAKTSFSGEWQVDETLESLSDEGLEAIVVGVPNTGSERLNEYSPFRDPKHGGGKGDAYLSFLINTVRPLIDQSFRTRRERMATGLMGSSMGGLISLYGLFRYGNVFGLCGAMSPSIWFARGTVYHYIERQPPVLGRIYMDMGLREYSENTQPLILRRLLERSGTRAGALAKLLQSKGYRLGHELRYVEDHDGTHSEGDWARRLPDALRFLLSAWEG